MFNLDGYRIEQLIYAGSRSLIFRGIRQIDLKRVIIKVLSQKTPSSEAVNRLVREYETVRLLKHENIVSYLALEKYGHSYALIEADDGAEELGALIPQNGLNVTDFLNIAEQAVRGLASVHEQGMIHKDLKPQNFICHAETGKVKLIDFGLVSLLDDEMLQAPPYNLIEGTLAYISPEQTGRMNRQIDTRSDLYSLGVTFYQALCGQIPFDFSDPMKLIYHHIATTAVPLQERKPAVPKILADMVAKLMAKNAEDRYQSCSGLLFDLRKCAKAWQELGNIEVFELGQGDFSKRLNLSGRLYGREVEISELERGFEDVQTGQLGVALVSGPSGCGKSSLAFELQKKITGSRGWFFAGKFEEFQQDTPYLALSQALQRLFDFLLAEPEASLTKWREEVQQALGESGGLLIDLIPKALAPFEQVHSDLDRKYEGTGLGLPLTKSLVELHGGSLDLQSRYGVGTTVTVRLPEERIVPVE